MSVKNKNHRAYKKGEMLKVKTSGSISDASPLEPFPADTPRPFSFSVRAFFLMVYRFSQENRTTLARGPRGILNAVLVWIVPPTHFYPTLDYIYFIASNRTIISSHLEQTKNKRENLYHKINFTNFHGMLDKYKKHSVHSSKI